MSLSSDAVPKLLAALGIDFERRGSAFWASCPTPEHRDSDPSWSMNEEGSHHCHGCGFGGGPAELVSAVRGCSVGQALRWIREGGLNRGVIPESIRVRLVSRARRFAIDGVKFAPLFEWATVPRRYMAGRGVTADQVARWGIGYAVGGRLDCRIVFPIFASDGRAISYHARTFADADRRYLYPRRTEGADPGAMFGETGWPPIEARRSSTLVVTEGAFDALAAERAGAEFIAAFGGSDVNPRHILRLSSWGRIVVASDGDSAGESVYRKIVGKFGGRRGAVVRAAIPEGFDANEMDPAVLSDVLRAAL